MSLFIKKPIDKLVAEADDSEKGLKRTIGPGNLIALGIGAIIGGTILAAIIFTSFFTYFITVMQSQSEKGKVDAGEIVGLSGLVGAGRSELARTIFGLTPADRGEILVRGKRVRIGSPADAIARGIAYVPRALKLFCHACVIWQ